MRAVLYHPWVYLRGGAERVLLETLHRSRHEWTLYTHHFDASGTFDEFRDHHVVELEPRVSVARSLMPLVRAAATIGRAQIPSDAGEALLVSTEGLGDLVLSRTELPAVAYCHTPLKILHDPMTREALRTCSPVKSALAAAISPAFRSVDARMWRRYRHVLANSNETRARIAHAGLCSWDQIEVLTPGVDVGTFGAGFSDLAGVDAASEREPMFLVAGRIQWQKNIEMAIEAVRQALTIGFTGRLVVAGAVDEKSRPYIASLRQRAGGLPITFEENPTDARLDELYTSAAALVFTARNEDFGIVPLEAMAAGTPVLAVDAGGPRETVVHGVTGWLLANDARAFAQQMCAVEALATNMGPMRRACRARAEQFSWDTMVERIDDVMEQVAARQPVAPAASTVTDDEVLRGVARDTIDLRTATGASINDRADDRQVRV